MLVDLEDALNREPCPGCGIARMRAVDCGASRLNVECSGACGWRGYAELPELRKQIIYLDTAPISHIARARLREDDESPYLRLFEALRAATADHAICCVASSVNRHELEQFENAESAVDVMNELTSARVRFPWEVRHRQVLRALDVFLAGGEPDSARAIDIEDAFEESPNAWLPQLSVATQMRYPSSYVESSRADKSAAKEGLVGLHRRFTADGLGFEAVRLHEGGSFGETLPWNEQQYAQILTRVGQATGLPQRDVFERAQDFARSEHLAAIPWLDLASRLHAAVAISARGDVARAAKTGDLDDIQHVTTYLPYVDVILVDSFFHDLCRKLGIDLETRYGSRVRTPRRRSLPEFIAEIEDMVRVSPNTELARRIHRAIREGGHQSDFRSKVDARLGRRRAFRDEDPPEAGEAE